MKFQLLFKVISKIVNLAWYTMSNGKPTEPRLGTADSESYSIQIRHRLKNMLALNRCLCVLGVSLAESQAS